MRSASSLGWKYWSPLLVVIVVGFDIPILFLVGWSVASPFPTLAHYAELASSKTYLTIYRNTFGLAAVVTVACVALGYPLAYWMHRQTGRIQLAALTFIVLSCWVSILVRTYAWIVVLGNAGIVNKLLLQAGLIATPMPFLYNSLGVAIGTTNILLPYLVLPLFASMGRIDGRLLLAAESLGASASTTFWRVFFPLTVPALLAGSLLVFILALGFFVTPAILGGGKVMMVSNLLDLLINELPQWELAAAVSVVLLVATLALYSLARRIENVRSV